MKLYCLDNEIGEGKALLITFPIGDQPNYLMFATNKGNTARATIYIINNDPTEEQLKDAIEAKIGQETKILPKEEKICSFQFPNEFHE